MRRRIKVFLGESAQIVGTLHHDQQPGREFSAFEYDRQWLETATAFAIEPGLPLVSGPQYHKKSRHGSAFQGAFADSEPDGWGKRIVLRDYAKRRNKARKSGAEVAGAVLNGLDYLLAVDDICRVGALRFMDEDGVFQRNPEDGRRTAPPFIELSRLRSSSYAVESDSETEQDLQYLRGRGTSLGGMRPKCSVLGASGQLSIGKFPSVQDERPVTTGEILALNLAKAAGLNVANANLVDSDGVPVALIRRFDRTRSGSRIHYISAATLLGADPTDATQYFYTDIADAIRVHGADAQRDIEELWRRIVFSILITNIDDHLMNHGFLHVNAGKWRLSPAFDINPFPERIREFKTWISADVGPDASMESLFSKIAYFRITSTKAKGIIAEVENSTANWRNEARALGMNAKDIDRFSPAFEHTERDVARKISGAKTT